METRRLVTRTGGSVKVSQDDAEGLAASLRGTLHGPGEEPYEESRSIWNAMIDRKPGLVARCRGASDVRECVRFAREHDLLVSVKGAGHNIAGSAVCEGGLMIDLSAMSSARVDPDSRTVRVEPGATLGDLDRETQVHGLAVPVGINSTTGIAGLALGGGVGWLGRKHGMTVDNLLSADVVTADGEIVTASPESHPDLFWALRGGGGNFGIVTSFEFRAHRVGPEVVAGLIFHPVANARAALSFYRDFAASAPDDLTCWVVLRKAPPLPDIPEEWHGKEVLVFAHLFAGHPEEAEAALRPLRGHGEPIVDLTGPVPFTAFQAAFDPLLEPGARNYWKSHIFDELSDGLIDELLEFVSRLPHDESEIFLGHLGGVQNRVDPDATAYWHRNAACMMNIHTRWRDPSDDEKCRSWAREAFEATGKHATGGVYSNFVPEDEPERVRSAYGGNWDRLVKIKRTYDPDNFFRTNLNVRP